MRAVGAVALGLILRDIADDPINAFGITAGSNSQKALIYGMYAAFAYAIFASMKRGAQA